MPAVKELREKRVQFKNEVLRLRDVVSKENREFTAEEQTAWDKVNKEYDQLTRQIEVLERSGKIEKEMADPVGDPVVGREDRGAGDPPGTPPAKRKREPATDDDRTHALAGWMRSRSQRPISKRQRLAAERCQINLRSRSLELLLPDRAPRNLREAGDVERITRAQSAVSGPAGNYLVPPATMVAAIEKAMILFNPVRAVAQVIRTESGEDMPWPTADDTSNTGERLGENTAVSEQDVTVGQITWKAHKYSSKLIKVPVELLEDSAFDIVTLLGEMLGERIARRQNTDFTVGTGAAQPKGIVAASTMGKTTASATAIAADEIIDLVHSVQAPYRVGAAFMMHDLIVSYLRKLKDGQGRYLWEASLVEGTPDRLHTFSVFVNQDMASTVATTNKTVLFGQMAKYKIRDVRVVRMRRLIERYAEVDQEGFVGFQRSDGNLLDAGVAPVKHLLQA